MKSKQKQAGSGWGYWQKGKQITSIKDLEVGQIYLQESSHFNNAKNVVLITSGDKLKADRPIVYGVFVDPHNKDEKRMPGDQEFSIWDFELIDDKLFQIKPMLKSALRAFYIAFKS